MTDIISRQAAIDAAMKVIERDTSGKNVVVEAMEAWKVYIMRLPSAVDPVKHGKWIKDGEAYALYKCSACNEFCPEAGYADCIPIERMYKTFKFCPNCGARMVKGGEA